METQQYKVVRREDGRYVITNAQTHAVIDNANGYGYTTGQNAEKAAWYKFKGGKGKKEAEKREATAFWRQYTAFGKAIQEYYDTWYKEIARGETDPKTDLDQLAQEMGVAGFKQQYIEYLP
jgi:hypothetical protein